MISPLYLIAGIHSATNLKTYEQAKIFFNPSNPQFSSGESFKKSVKSLFVFVPFSLGWICKYWIYVIDDIGVFATLFVYT